MLIGLYLIGRERFLLKNYLNLFNQKGIKAFGQADHGGGISYSSISYELIKKFSEENNISFTPRYYLFAYRFFRLHIASKFYISLMSFILSIYSIALNKRIIKYPLFCKN